MRSRIRISAALLAMAAAFAATPLRAQDASVGVGAEFLGYSFDDDSVFTDAAQLFLVPVAIRIPVVPEVVFDVYSAWGQGRIEQNGQQLELSGIVDTRLKVSVQATPWALLTVGANLPTGNASHSPSEAAVASVLSTDLLGFRESTFGGGTAITSSLATAVRAGGFGIGVAGAYSVRSEFEPSAVDSIRYTPGNETRIRVGLDRNFGGSTFTAGGTYIMYTEDRANGVNLFQSGERIRFDASYAFRANAGVWTLYGAHLIRASGDLSRQIVDNFGAVVGDTTIATAEQNLSIAGLVGTVGIGDSFVFRPQVDLKLQSRSDPGGSDAGSGWIVSAGADIPFRIFGRSEFFPKARVLVGSIKGADGGSVGLMGTEIKGTILLPF